MPKPLTLPHCFLLRHYEYAQDRHYIVERPNGNFHFAVMDGHGESDPQPFLSSNRFHPTTSTLVSIEVGWLDGDVLWDLLPSTKVDGKQQNMSRTPFQRTWMRLWQIPQTCHWYVVVEAVVAVEV